MKFTKALICATIKSMVVFLLLSHFQINAQDSLATVYFYRLGKFEGPVVGYNVNEGERRIGVIRSNSAFKHRCGPGLHVFNAKTESEAAFKLVVEPGKTYYIECGVAVGISPGRPSFRLTTDQDALKSFSKMDTTVADKTPFIAVKANPTADTVRALQNLYKRKRVGGTVRGIVFGALAMSTLVNTVNYQPTSVTVNGQTIPIDDSPPPGNYLGIGVFSLIAITGFTQIGNHTHDRLDALLKGYNNGIPLPQQIKKKLKQKDFRTSN